MKTVVLLISILSFSLPAFSQISSKSKSPSLGTFGFGLIIGNHPWFGITAKLWLGNKLAMDAVVGYREDLHLQANLTSNRRLIWTSKGGLFFTYGAGFFAEMPNTDHLGLQVIGGMEAFLPWKNLSMFAEYIPAADFKPGDDHIFQPVNFVGGVRYYF